MIGGSAVCWTDIANPPIADHLIADKPIAKSPITRSPDRRFRFLPPSASPSAWCRRHGRWLETQQLAVVLGCKEVQETVWPLTYVANALLQLAQHRLAVQLF